MSRRYTARTAVLIADNGDESVTACLHYATGQPIEFIVFEQGCPAKPFATEELALHYFDERAALYEATP